MPRRDAIISCIEDEVSSTRESTVPEPEDTLFPVPELRHPRVHARLAELRQHSVGGGTGGRIRGAGNAGIREANHRPTAAHEGGELVCPQTRGHVRITLEPAGRELQNPHALDIVVL